FLPIVRERLRRFHSLEAEVAAAFPKRGGSSDHPRASDDPFRPLPNIPGYELVEMIGAGGMGIVYSARQRNLNRMVAIKMLLAGGYAGPRELERFKREAESIAALRHPNIVQVFEAGEHDGFPYFSMEFMDSGSLSEALKGTPLPARKAAEAAALLARAVQA